MRAPRPSRSHPTAPADLAVELSRVAALMRKGRADDAAEKLQELDTRYPDRVDVLSELVGAFQAAGAVEEARAVADRLVRLHPRDPLALQLQIGADLAAEAPATAITHARAFLAAHPHDPWAPSAARMADELDALLRDAAAAYHIAPADAHAAFDLQEQAMKHLMEGRLPAARRAVATLRRRAPHMVTAVINLALLEWEESQRVPAMNTLRQALAVEPDSHHARSLLVRFLFLSGDVEAAAAEGAWLRGRTLEGDDHLDCAIAFSWLGDDAAVLDCLDGALAAARKHLEGPPPALLLHLGAVAAVRSGNERRARQLWRTAQRSSDPPAVIYTNLDDQQLPVVERHGPWAFEMEEWLGDAFVTTVERFLQRGDERSFRRTLRNTAKTHPGLARLVPAILDRASPILTDTILQMVGDGTVPVMTGTAEAVVAFTLGQRGSDALRLRASQVAMRHGWLPNGEHRMWRGGRWETMLLMGCEIHDEPLIDHPSRIARAMEHAIAALRSGDLATAETLLQAALLVRPDAPDVRHNLAKLRELQGRYDETIAISRDIHARLPDYLFARVSLASDALKHGRLDEARALIDPLMLRSRLHFSELRALVDIQVQIALAEGNAGKAKRWRELGAVVEE